MNLKLIAIDSKFSELLIQPKKIAFKRKIGLGIKSTLLFFGVALIFLPVPFLHFFFVPGFLLIGLASFIKVMNSDYFELLNIEIKCPTCEYTITFNGKLYSKPTKEICPNCRSLLRLFLDKA